MDRNDGQSVLHWVERLREAGSLMGFKSSSDPVPAGFEDLWTETFCLMIQTEYQRELFKREGHQFAGIDATHNTTHYENTSLFTVIVRDKWGHGKSRSHSIKLYIDLSIGMPIVWMIASNATEAMIDYFLATLQAKNPDVIPKFLMTDFDKGQINAARCCYPESQLLLCWWHVAHAWQQHFVTAHYKNLWTELKKWYRLTTKAEFDACWEKIQALALESIIDYISQHWLPHVHLWSAMYREGRTVFEQCDTNMLVEVYVCHFNCSPSEAHKNLQLAPFIEGYNARREAQSSNG